MKGTIQVHRFMGSHEIPLKITVTDGSSHTECVEIQITAENLMFALTGSGCIPCEFELRPKFVGKKHEAKTELVKCSRPFGNKILLRAAKAAMKKLEVDGWKGREYDLGNAHNYTPEGINVSFTRFVDAE